jgi:hypothetical protein
VLWTCLHVHVALLPWRPTSAMPLQLCTHGKKR